MQNESESAPLLIATALLASIQEDKRRSDERNEIIRVALVNGIRELRAIRRDYRSLIRIPREFEEATKAINGMKSALEMIQEK